MKELAIQPLQSTVERQRSRLPQLSREGCYKNDAHAEHVGQGSDMIKVNPEDRVLRSREKIFPIKSILFSIVAVVVVAALYWHYMPLGLDIRQ